MGRPITQVVTGHWHWEAGVQSTESTNIAAWSRHHSTLRTLQWLCTCCRHHVTIMLTSVQTQETVGHLLLSLSHGPRTGSMFVTVCCPAVTSGIIVVVLPNLALEAGNQPGNSGAARGLAPGPVSAGCRGLALRMSPDRPGAVPMWQLWAGKVCQDTATITFIDHSRSNKFASVITGRLCSKAHFWHWACKHSDTAISLITL